MVRIGGLNSLIQAFQTAGPTGSTENGPVQKTPSDGATALPVIEKPELADEYANRFLGDAQETIQKRYGYFGTEGAQQFNADMKGWLSNKAFKDRKSGRYFAGDYWQPADLVAHLANKGLTYEDVLYLVSLMKEGAANSGPFDQRTKLVLQGFMELGTPQAAQNRVSVFLKQRWGMSSQVADGPEITAINKLVADAFKSNPKPNSGKARANAAGNLVQVIRGMENKKGSTLFVAPVLIATPPSLHHRTALPATRDEYVRIAAKELFLAARAALPSTESASTKRIEAFDKVVKDTEISGLGTDYVNGTFTYQGQEFAPTNESTLRALAEKLNDGLVGVSDKLKKTSPVSFDVKIKQGVAHNNEYVASYDLKLTLKTDIAKGYKLGATVRASSKLNQYQFLQDVHVPGFGPDQAGKNWTELAYGSVGLWDFVNISGGLLADPQEAYSGMGTVVGLSNAKKPLDFLHFVAGAQGFFLRELKQGTDPELKQKVYGFQADASVGLSEYKTDPEQEDPDYRYTLSATYFLAAGEDDGYVFHHFVGITLELIPWNYVTGNVSYEQNLDPDEAGVKKISSSIIFHPTSKFNFGPTLTWAKNLNALSIISDGFDSDQSIQTGFETLDVGGMASIGGLFDICSLRADLSEHWLEEGQEGKTQSSAASFLGMLTFQCKK